MELRLFLTEMANMMAGTEQHKACIPTITNGKNESQHDREDQEVITDWTNDCSGGVSRLSRYNNNVCTLHKEKMLLVQCLNYKNNLLTMLIIL